MGYTHYWNWHGRPEEHRLRACLADMGRVVSAVQDLLAGPVGEGRPEVTPLHLVFNGIGDDGHEPFEFPGREGFNFCKTLEKPYDRVVTACLLVARDHFSPEVLDISSDGSWDAGWDGAGWHDGAFVYHGALA